MGELYPVNAFLIIPNFSNLSISFCIIGFWSSQMLYSWTKNGLSSLNLSWTSKYGQVSISLCMLNAAVFSNISCIKRSFSAVGSTLLSRGTFSLKISSSDICLLESSLSNHGYGSSVVLCALASCSFGVFDTSILVWACNNGSSFANFVGSYELANVWAYSTILPSSSTGISHSKFVIPPSFDLISRITIWAPFVMH